ncbi:hypothetical protein [Bacillus sp. ISL-7]|nr:hypothetical protein [Bacillus sp. ISL-7]
MATPSTVSVVEVLIAFVLIVALLLAVLLGARADVQACIGD